MFVANRAENGAIFDSCFDNTKEDAAVDIDVCSEAATVQICASAFASKKETVEKIGDRSGMMLQRARAIVPLKYGSRMKLRSSTTTPLMKTVAIAIERPCILNKRFHDHATYTAERRF